MAGRGSRGEEDALRQRVGQMEAQLAEVREEMRGIRAEVVGLLAEKLAQLHQDNETLRYELGSRVNGARTALDAQLPELRALLSAERTAAERALREILDMRRAEAEARLAEREARDARAARPPAAAEECHDLFARAAGVARAGVVCHRDTWSFVVEHAARAEHFRLPAEVVEREDGTVEAQLSGRTLIAVIDALWHVQHDPGASAATYALAGEIRSRIDDALSGGQETARVVIDGRAHRSDTAHPQLPEIP
ncbi:hypothetical protein ACL02R_21475 [Streptomyces sp. MS19]|uniref:hypothetical protein n=1 Tax=Streptomyces sp. MS19 TaxID=3385972 RepID=UPI0039A38B66